MINPLNITYEELFKEVEFRVNTHVRRGEAEPGKRRELEYAKAQGMLELWLSLVLIGEASRERIDKDHSILNQIIPLE